MQNYLRKIISISSASALAFLAAPVLDQYAGDSSITAAHAAESGHGTDSGHSSEGGHGGKGPKYQGGKGAEGHGGSDSAHKGSSSHGGGSKTLESSVLQSGAGRSSGKGRLYRDLRIILRDGNGVPILTPEGYTQPLDASGNLIPLDAEGAPVDASLVQEVELSRLNVSRAPATVLSKSLGKAVAKIAAGTTITLDAAGRVVIDGTTIDSPLENLALYKAMMTNTLPDAVIAKLPANATASSFLAAAADKTSTINTDVVVYLNSFLGVNTVTNGVTTSYYTFSKDYDREAAYKDATATVLVPQADGTYQSQSVNIYTTVFGGSNWVDPTPDSSAEADDFSAAANDALRVIQFVHDNAVR